MLSNWISPDTASSSGGPPLVAVAGQSNEVRDTRRHRHARGQLLGAQKGLLSVSAGSDRWVVPATHAVWVPPGIEHGLRSHGPFNGWSLYVAAAHCEELPAQACVLEVSGLLYEATARAASWQGDGLDDVELRLASVILDEIRTSPQVELGLPMPRDVRLQNVAQALSDQPGDTRHMEAWAGWAGVAPRTLTRRFVAETGFTFTAWRQRVRLLKALELLADGRAVTAVALDLGHDNVSAFIALFRRTFGVTPGHYQSLMR